jgi:hypothetical protein
MTGDLPEILRNVVMRWVMGSEPTVVPVDNHMRQLIELGVGYLKAVGENEFNPEVNYPVYIDEPLLVLSLLSIFDSQEPTHARSWITRAFAAARNRSAIGSMFEELTALVLLENLGRKTTALGEVFHVADPSLASKKVTLVALRRTSEKVMQCDHLERGAYTSDRLCFKASNPDDVLLFLRNPAGIMFLFPDIHMGPDVIAFAQEQETGELIILAVQCKLSKPTPQLWTDAVRSVTPDFFYTVTSVRFNITDFHDRLIISTHLPCRMMGNEHNMLQLNIQVSRNTWSNSSMRL